MENLTLITALTPIALLIVAQVISRFTNVLATINLGRSVLITTVLSALGSLVYVLSTDMNTNLFSLLNGNFSFRIDALTLTMLLMVSIIGFIVVGFSKNYLHGDANQNKFLQRLMTTIALVQVFAISGSLVVLFIAWVLTSFSLQKLIGFDKSRVQVQAAVKKKFVVARLSDIALLVSFGFLYKVFQTTDLALIFDRLSNLQSFSWELEVAVVSLVFAGLLKSVQVPFHGWVLEVMEAPTPVSGLLHAGLLNAGPFLMIRFSHLLDVSTFGSSVLLVVGGISALYGTLVYPTQSAVKTGLAYSSIGHMGFSLMLCGLGLYSASLLHLIAHSFYKAHAFLSSGSAIDKYRLGQLKSGVETSKSVWPAFTAFAIACGLFAGIALLFGIDLTANFELLSLGIIITAGVSSFVMKFVTLEHGALPMLLSIAGAGFVLSSFFLFEELTAYLLEGQIPLKSALGSTEQTITILLLSFFIITIFSSEDAQQSKGLFGGVKWQTYKRNGFYVHTVVDNLFSK